MLECRISVSVKKNKSMVTTGDDVVRDQEDQPRQLKVKIRVNCLYGSKRYIKEINTNYKTYQ